MIIVNGFDPLLIYFVQGILHADPLRLRHRIGNLEQPLEETACSFLQNTERQYQLLGLNVEIFMRLCPFGRCTNVKDCLLEVIAVDQLLEVEIIAVLAHTVECLVE